MFIIEQIDNESSIQNFKDNITTHSYDLTFSFRPRKIGLYSKIYKNLIIIKNVSEEEDRGGPIFMHFYGLIFKKRYIIGIICPKMIYTLFTLAICITPYEVISIKIISPIIWFYIYLSNINNGKFIRNKLFEWLRK